MSIQALVQRRAGRRHLQAQRAGKEGITAKCLDGIEIALALAQQGQVAFEDGVVANPRANRKGALDQPIGLDMRQIFVHQSQTGVRGQASRAALESGIHSSIISLVG